MLKFFSSSLFRLFILIFRFITPLLLFIAVISTVVSLFAFSLTYVSYQGSIRDRRTYRRLTLISRVLILIYQALTVLPRVSSNLIQTTFVLLLLLGCCFRKPGVDFLCFTFFLFISYHLRFVYHTCDGLDKTFASSI